MKSKSLKDNEDKARAFDFLHLYKKADETTVKLKPHEELNDSTAKSTKERNKNRAKPPNKHNLKQGHQDASKPIMKRTTPGNDMSKKDKAATKPIIRNSGNNPDISNTKPKKRNKSVSFILDENEEVEVKKTKSETFAKDGRDTRTKDITSKDKIQKRKIKKKLKDNFAEKENSNATSEESPDIERDINILKDSAQVSGKGQVIIDSEVNKVNTKKKRIKELRKFHKEQKFKGQEELEQNAETLPENNVDSSNIQDKKSKQKKKKHSTKTVEDIDTNDGEPALKSRRKDVKPEAVAEDLKNLNIGDNTHTLTNLLDEMVVADKKQKKKKHKQNKGNQPITSKDINLEKSKLKEKWRKKRWNKDKKPFVPSKGLSFTVIVDNLPNRIILNYKKLLAEHFSKCGAVKKIGVAEIYLTDDPKPVFSTTILFDNKDSALKALEEDNTSFEGNFIRVKQPLSPNKTTLVVRSYGEITEHALSSAFNSAGRIRNIQIINKKKKTLGLAFIEFDGPAALDRAVQIAEDIKIGGKKVHVSKFEFRSVSLKPDQVEKSVTDQNDSSSDSSDD